MSLFSDRIKQLRMSARESLSRASSSVGLSKHHLWALETEKTVNPSLSVLKRISDEYNVSIAWLVGENEATDQSMVLLRQLNEMSTEDQQFIHGIIGLVRDKRLSNADSTNQ